MRLPNWKADSSARVIAVIIPVHNGQIPRRWGFEKLGGTDRLIEVSGKQTCHGPYRLPLLMLSTHNWLFIIAQCPSHHPTGSFDPRSNLWDRLQEVICHLWVRPNPDSLVLRLCWECFSGIPIQAITVHRSPWGDPDPTLQYAQSESLLAHGMLLTPSKC